LIMLNSTVGAPTPKPAFRCPRIALPHRRQRKVNVHLGYHLRRLAIQKRGLVDPLLERVLSRRDQQGMAADQLNICRLVPREEDI
jgi:hypothetical protein